MVYYSMKKRGYLEERIPSYIHKSNPDKIEIVCNSCKRLKAMVKKLKKEKQELIGRIDRLRE